MKTSEYPVGTHIEHDFDEYIKNDRHWVPLDYMSNSRTFSEMDYFQERGDKIEILAMPWSVIQGLLKSVKYWQKAANGAESADWLILKNVIDNLNEEEDTDG